MTCSSYDAGMGDTSAAVAANRRRGLEKLAAKLRAAGYLVVAPEDRTDGETAGPFVVSVAGPRRVEFAGAHASERPRG